MATDNDPTEAAHYFAGSLAANRDALIVAHEPAQHGPHGIGAMVTVTGPLQPGP
jgi:hypothetical protein